MSVPLPNSAAATLFLRQLPTEKRAQIFLFALSVFDGGWTLAAAEEVCEEPQADERCESLLRLALIVRAEGERGKEPRYSMPEAVRVQARQQLGEADWQALRARHRAYYGALARQAGPHLQRAPDWIWFERLETESKNLLAAVDSARNVEALELALCLWRWCLEKGHLTDGQRMLVYALARCHDVPENLKAEAYRGIGALLLRGGKSDPAMKYLRLSLRAALQSELQTLLPYILTHLGHLERERSRVAEARKYYALSLELWQAQQDTWGQATAFTNQGILAWVEANLEEAHAKLSVSAAMYSQMGDKRQAIKVFNNMAMIAVERGHYVVAEKAHLACLEMARQLGDGVRVASSLHNLGDLYCYMNKYDEAIRCLKESLIRLRDLGRTAELPFSIASLGKAYFRKHDLKRALILMGAVEKLREQYPVALPEFTRQEHESILTDIRAVLQPQTYSRYWNRGRRMSMETVLAYIASL